MNLDSNQNDFKALISLTSQSLNIPSHFIEKDYWVTYVLSNLSKSRYSDSFIFKGGTSLSKAYKVIERFSEDVDLTVSLEGVTGNQRKKVIDYTAKDITKGLPEVNKLGITSKGSQFRRTVHEYPKYFSKIDKDQSSENIIIEINSFIQPKDYVRLSIETYIAEFLRNTHQESVIDEYGLNSFELNVLSLKRTFTEKLLSLVRASYLNVPLYELQERVRHFYDIYRLFENKEVREFFYSEEFKEYLLKTKNDDASNKEFYGEWVKNRIYEAPVFSNFDIFWEDLRKTYNGIFRFLVYGELPSDSLIYETFKEIIKRIEFCNEI